MGTDNITSTVLADIADPDAIRAKFTIDLQKSTFQALFPLTLRGSTIFLV